MDILAACLVSILVNGHSTEMYMTGTVLEEKPTYLVMDFSNVAFEYDRDEKWSYYLIRKDDCVTKKLQKK